MRRGDQSRRRRQHRGGRAAAALDVRRRPLPALARIELRVIVDEWLRRIPDFELDADTMPPLIINGRFLTPSGVPLRWRIA